MTSTRELLARDSELWRLSTRLPGAYFGQSPACAGEGVDPELFFPVSGEDTERIRTAKDLCGRCPIRAACREFALHQSVHGIWGGLTEGERDRARRGPGSESVTGVAA